MSVEDFFEGYVTAALWSSTDNGDPSGGQPLDANFSGNDIEPETLARMRADCESFLSYVEAWAREGSGGRPLEEIMAAASAMGLDMLDPGGAAAAGDLLIERGWSEEDVDALQVRAPLLALIETGDLETADAGHNFWLSRNGHGAGFFDSDEYRGQEDLLQDMARTFGTFDLTVNFPDEYLVFADPGEEMDDEERYHAAMQMAIDAGDATIYGQ